MIYHIRCISSRPTYLTYYIRTTSMYSVQILSYLKSALDVGLLHIHTPIGLDIICVIHCEEFV